MAPVPWMSTPLQSICFLLGYRLETLLERNSMCSYLRTTGRSRLDCGKCKPGMFTGKKKFLVPQRIIYQNKVDSLDIPQQDDVYSG